jgi:AsmA family
MTESDGSNGRIRRWLRITLATIAILVLILVVPPFISVSRFKSQITQLIARSLGRPVRLSSVQAHILPWPGFEISDLSVAEDPAYGAEPVLHASKVTASIRLLALFSGRVEIGKISVDEASLNLVRAGPGRWNLDSILRTAAAQAEPSSGTRRPAPLPYLEATNSRINFKNGAEKLPFSLVNADLSLWQESPGEWRIRLRGQPARTDVSLYLEETGVVRVEASMRRTPALRQMPLHLDVDWQEAQLGQLARLITGSDPGWRGDLTGELRLDGTPDAAQVAIRLRATGVHRAEFTPAAPLDFDARCNLIYHYAEQSVQNMDCDSPLGDGRVHVTGEKVGEDAPPRFSVELDRIPVTAGLDALRTLRNGLASDLEAKGTVSGKIVYDTRIQANAAPVKPISIAEFKRKHAAISGAEPVGPLNGSFTVEGLIISGDGLGQPLQAPKFTLEPVAVVSVSPQLSATTLPAEAKNPAQALAGSIVFPAGGAVPLTFNVRFALTGYQIGIRGQASYARARELTQATGIPASGALATLAGDPVAVDLTAEGPWMPAEEIPMGSIGSAEAAPNGAPESSGQVPKIAPKIAPAIAPTIGASPEPPVRDTLTGTVNIRNANWKADYLAGHVVVNQATLHIENGDLRWDPVDLTYGPLKATASLILPSACAPEQTPPSPCPAQFQLHFADLDAAALQSALLGAREKGTLLSDLIDRLHPSSAPPWPPLEGVVTADSLILGPVTLQGVSTSLRIVPTGAEISSLDASIFGGAVHLAGTVTKPATDRDKLAYSLSGDFEKLNAADVGRLLGLRWTGEALSGSGNLDLSGYTGDDLSSSAKGTLHFEVLRGTIADAKPATTGSPSKPPLIPAALARFDRWTADATIANGNIQLGQNQIIAGPRKQSVEATITFGDPPQLSFPAPKETRAEGSR